MVYKIPLQPLPKIEEVYEIERETVWRCTDHRCILLFISDGSCQIELDGVKSILNKGDVFLIPAGKRYIRRPVKERICKLFYVHFIPDAALIPISYEDAQNELRKQIAKDTALSARNRLSHLPPYLYLRRHTQLGEDFDRISALLHQLLSIRHVDSYTTPMLISLYLAEFVTSISLHPEVTVAEETANRNLPPPLRQAVSFIQQNYDKKLSADSICAHCHISPQHLIRLFKKHFGMTPLQYITQDKITKAIELLRNSELSVKEIAYSLGYDNPNYFSRLFAAEEGYSPSEMRERIRTYREGSGALIEK